MKNPIPEQALDKHIAFLGGTGSGKTSAAKSAIVEPALKRGERVIVIDPTGAYWGLRLDRNGKGKGFQNIYIFGGDRADYPLRARDADTLADAFCAARDSAIFDVSLMTVSERTMFFTNFAEAILRKNRGPLRFVIDECHLFMPQAGVKAGGAIPAMLHAANNLVSLGRSKGLRITLISQRPAKVHKDSLSQVQSLVAMRLLAPQDRTAIAAWIEDQADASKGHEIIASLPGLKPGEGWVWAPLADSLERVRFDLPATFDSSRAPDLEDGKGPTLPPINLDALKGRLATVEAEVKANDPKLLRAEIERLKREASVVVPAKVETRDVPVLGDDQRDAILRIADVVCAADFQQLQDCLGVVRKHLVTPKLPPVAAFKGILSPAPSQPPTPKPLVPRAAAAAPASANGISAPQMRVLSSVAFWQSVGTESPNRHQVAAVAGYSPSSGGFNNLLGQLNTANLLSIPEKGHVSLVEGAPVVSLTREEARDKVLTVLSAPQKKLVEAALAQVEPISRDELGAAAGYSPTSGGFNNLVGQLNTLTIFTKLKTKSGYVEVTGWARDILS